MPASADWSAIADVARHVERDPDAAPQLGATPGELQDLEVRLSQPLPVALAEWLVIINGDTIGEGGVRRKTGLAGPRHREASESARGVGGLSLDPSRVGRHGELLRPDRRRDRRVRG